uniref:Uncharacterized protein n=1 Tax=Haemonchus contortus TaxID=6289 RepID=A0A7I5E526_HAECO
MIYEVMVLINLFIFVIYPFNCARRRAFGGRNRRSCSKSPKDRRSKMESIQRPPRSRSRKRSKQIQKQQEEQEKEKQKQKQLLQQRQQQKQKQRTQAVRRAKTNKDSKETVTGMDEGGYEVCPDMTPSQLERAKNMDDGAANNQLMTVL